jgi:hypothetical protein
MSYARAARERSTSAATARAQKRVSHSRERGRRPRHESCVTPHHVRLRRHGCRRSAHTDVLCGFPTDTPRTPLDGAGGKLLPPPSPLQARASSSGACVRGGMDAGAFEPRTALVAFALAMRKPYVLRGLRHVVRLPLVYIVRSCDVAAKLRCPLLAKFKCPLW